VLLVHCQRAGVYDFWVAPGGGAQGIEDLLATARREVQEECGLQIEPRQLAYIEEFHNPTTRFCKLWFTADVIGETVLDVTGPHARCEFITQGAFLSRDVISKLTVFPAVLQSQYWIDRAAGFAAPRYLGIRAMEFW